MFGEVPPMTLRRAASRGIAVALLEQWECETTFASVDCNPSSRGQDLQERGGHKRVLVEARKGLPEAIQTAIKCPGMRDILDRGYGAPGKRLADRSREWHIGIDA